MSETKIIISLVRWIENNETNEEIWEKIKPYLEKDMSEPEYNEYSGQLLTDKGIFNVDILYHSNMKKYALEITMHESIAGELETEYLTSFVPEFFNGNLGDFKLYVYEWYTGTDRP